MDGLGLRFEVEARSSRFAVAGSFKLKPEDDQGTWAKA